MKNKHLPFYALIDACGSGECPVCFLSKKSVENYFESLLAEDINDIGFRKKFREQNGFCNYHSYKFLKYNDGLAVTIIQRDLLVQKIKSFKKSSKAPHRNNKKSKIKKHDKCIVCDVAKDTTLMFIKIIKEYLEDTEFKENFLKSPGLCIPHFELMMEKSESLPEWFVSYNKSKYAHLLSQADKYLEASNFSLGDKRPVLSKEDKDVWIKSVAVLSGYEGMQINY